MRGNAQKIKKLKSISRRIQRLGGLEKRKLYKSKLYDSRLIHYLFEKDTEIRGIGEKEAVQKQAL